MGKPIPLWIKVVSLLLACLLFFAIGTYVGRIANNADLARATAQLDKLRSDDDALLGRLGTSLGNALAESDRLARAGAGLEQSARAVAVLANGLHDAISSIARYEKARGNSIGSNTPDQAK